MNYDFLMDSNVIITRGYKSDIDCKLVITANSSPEFTTISEKLHGVNQEDKDVMTIAEVTPTFNKF